jgi:hypothetical protein
MKPKIRISIWIMAVFLAFLGLSLSSRQTLAASGLSTSRVANISVFVSQRSLASIFKALPSIGVAPSELSASHWQEMARYTASFYAASASSGIGLTSQSATDLGEQSLINGYRLQAIARFGALPATGVDLTTLSAVDILAYRWQAMPHDFLTHPKPWR